VYKRQALGGAGAVGAGVGADFFAVLVAVFAPELRAEGNAHLCHLWLLLPALSLAHCEALCAAKERLAARPGSMDAAAAGFTEDGFALGAAYLLRLLGQERQWDTLRWGDAAERFYGAQAGGGAADLRNTRAAALLAEARLLHHTMAYARTFFEREE
jgi:hypothetical protein